jgi:kynurenine formamidase
MQLIDLSHEIAHKGIAHPRHTRPMIWNWVEYEDTRRELGTGPDGHASMVKVVQMTDHTGTHVDAPKHFDPRPGALAVDEMPIEWCAAPAICLDFRDVPPKGVITANMLKEAVKKAGVPLEKGMIVLICTGHAKRFLGKPEYFTDWAGLDNDAIRWLGAQGIKNFGVEAINPGVAGDKLFTEHVVCREIGMIHMENLCNLENLVGKGKFIFMGLPLKFSGATGSPIRAVALLGDDIVAAWKP